MASPDCEQKSFNHSMSPSPWEPSLTVFHKGKTDQVIVHRDDMELRTL